MAEIIEALLEVDKITRWFLFILILMEFLSGWALVGKFGMDRLIPKEIAAILHAMLDIPTFILFLIHCLPRIYLKLKKR